MKVVHRNNEPLTSEHDGFSRALLLEKKGEPEAAIKVYRQLLNYHPTNAKVFDRLMIIYRKQKEYKKELSTINAAIKAFEEKFSEKATVHNKKVRMLSRALLKATGLADKKGDSIYLPGELARWKRRKALVQKKIKE